MNLFDVTDYRKYLIFWLDSQKRTGSSTAASLAESIRVHPTFVSQVLKGKKDFSIEQWMQVYQLMNLTEIEKEFLHFLLLKNRAGTMESKQFYQNKIDEILKRRLVLQERMGEHKVLSDLDRAVFYSSWLYSAVRLFTACDDGKTTVQVSEKFEISKDKAQSILDFLVLTGLCRFQKDKYLMGEQHIHVSSGTSFVVRHHTNWRLKSIENLEKTTAEEMNFTAPMSISKRDFGVIREKIVKLIQESVEVAKASAAEDLAVMTIDFFWPVKK